MQRLNYGFFVALILAAPLCLAAPNLKALPVPPNEAPEIIADDMRVNGAPMRIVQFTTHDVEKTLAFYREFFGRHGKEGIFAENRLQGKRLIGALMDETLVNVEISPSGKTAAYVLVSSVEPKMVQKPEKLAGDIPRMPGTKVLQHQDSRDGAKSNRFIIMENRQSVEGNAMYLREHFIGRGWQRDKDQTIKSGEHRQLAFSKENRHTMVDIQKRPDQMTVVLYNEMNEK